MCNNCGIRPKNNPHNWRRPCHVQKQQQNGTQMVIKFYDECKPYYEFTNFCDDAPINLDGKVWRTTEHYFQAQKFIGNPHLMEQIRGKHGACEAFQIAKQNQHQIRQD